MFKENEELSNENFAKCCQTRGWVQVNFAVLTWDWDRVEQKRISKFKSKPLFHILLWEHREDNLVQPERFKQCLYFKYTTYCSYRERRIITFSYFNERSKFDVLSEVELPNVDAWFAQKLEFCLTVQGMSWIFDVS